MKAVLTLKSGSIYDDLPEKRYHFPKTYLKQMQNALHDWIIYYEPRRDGGPDSTGGRQAYFAIAVIEEIRPDPLSAEHFYGDISNFLPLLSPVPFKEASFYYESGLQRPDGGTNKGAFGRAVRNITNEEFTRIVAAGCSQSFDLWEKPEDQIPLREDIPLLEQVSNRLFRDKAFSRQVREAYRNTCAVTGLSLINGGGRPEVQAAHIRPVAKRGPDSVRNGLALTGTAHWLFDRGLISVDENFRLIAVERSLPEGLKSLIHAGKDLILPEESCNRPHPEFLHWHRENVLHNELL